MKILYTCILLLGCALRSGAQPLLSFDQTTKEMGTMLWHAPRTATFHVTNKGTSDLTITKVRTDCGCTNATWTQAPIGPGSAGTIQVTYDAETLGHFNKGVAVYTNLEEQPIYLTIMGNVSMTQTEPTIEYPYRVSDYYLSTDNIEFDDVSRGDRPTFALQIFNASKKSYHPELMHLPKYLTAQADPEVILPGRVGRMLITLDSDRLPTMGLTQTNIYLSRFMGDRVSKDTELGVSATLLPDLEEGNIHPDRAPHLEIDSTQITLDPVNKRGKTSGQLVLRNTGKSPLIISALQVYNPGLSVSINKQSIDPDDEQKLKISVNANSSYFKGRRRILLITNDPDRPKTVIDVVVKK